MQVHSINVSPSAYGYLLMCEETQEAVAIDPGQAEPVLKKINGLKAKLVGVWLTHHHWDHVGGVEELAAKVSGLKVYAHPKDKERIAGCNQEIKDGDVLRFGKLEAKVIYTLGHTQGSVVYHLKEGAFTGDTLLGGGCNYPFEANIGELMETLNDKLVRSLPRNTPIYFGREWTERNLTFTLKIDPNNQALKDRLDRVKKLRADGKPSAPSTLEEELQTNPFLRCDNSELRVRLLGEYGSTDPHYVFAKLLNMVM